MTVVVTLASGVGGLFIYQHNASTGVQLARIPIDALPGSVGYVGELVAAGPTFFLLGDVGVGTLNGALDTVSLCFTGVCVNVAHDGAQYIAFMQDGGVLTSPDTSVWTAQNDSGSGYTTTGAFAGGKYWSAGSLGLRSSSNLVTWATEPVGGVNSVFKIVDFLGSVFRQGGNALGYIDHGTVFKDGVAITDSAWSGLDNAGSHVVVCGVFNDV